MAARPSATVSPSSPDGGGVGDGVSTQSSPPRDDTSAHHTDPSNDTKPDLVSELDGAGDSSDGEPDDLPPFAVRRRLDEVGEDDDESASDLESDASSSPPLTAIRLPEGSPYMLLPDSPLRDATDPASSDASARARAGPAQCSPHVHFASPLSPLIALADLPQYGGGGGAVNVAHETMQHPVGAGYPSLHGPPTPWFTAGAPSGTGFAVDHVQPPPTYHPPLYHPTGAIVYGGPPPPSWAPVAYPPVYAGASLHAYPDTQTYISSPPMVSCYVPSMLPPSSGRAPAAVVNRRTPWIEPVASMPLTLESAQRDRSPRHVEGSPSYATYGGHNRRAEPAPHIPPNLWRKLNHKIWAYQSLSRWTPQALELASRDPAASNDDGVYLGYASDDVHLTFDDWLRAVDEMLIAMSPINPTVAATFEHHFQHVRSRHVPSFWPALRTYDIRTRLLHMGTAAHDLQEFDTHLFAAILVEEAEHTASSLRAYTLPTVTHDATTAESKVPTTDAPHQGSSGSDAPENGSHEVSTLQTGPTSRTSTHPATDASNDMIAFLDGIYPGLGTASVLDHLGRSGVTTQTQLAEVTYTGQGALEQLVEWTFHDHNVLTPFQQIMMVAGLKRRFGASP